MQFLIVLTMLAVGGTALCRNVEVPLNVANKVHLLQRLIMAGEKAELARLLPEMKEHINSGDDAGSTPLHWAVYEDDIDSARKLLEHEANPNIKDGNGLTALHEAARVGSPEMVSLFIDNGGNPEERDKRYQWDAMFWAAFSGKKKSLQTLMELVDTQNEKTRSNFDIYGVIFQPDDPLGMSGEDTDKMAKAKLLLDAGVVPDVATAMMVSQPADMTSLAKLFDEYADKVELDISKINTLVDINSGTKLLMKAMAVGSVAAAEFLLKHGADINATDAFGNNALVAKYDIPAQLEIAKLLIEKGIDVHSNIRTATLVFYSALLHDHVEVAEMLLAEVTEDGKNPLPDAYYIFSTPQGLVPTIKMAKSEEMRELLLDYRIDDKGRISKIFKEIEQADRKQQASQQQGQQGSSKQGSSKQASRMPNFLINFNEQAAEGKFKPVIGREKEINQVITVLGRKEKPNPVLVGAAGVGKTAIVEGLAQRIVEGDVPASMRDKTIYALDMGMLSAGSKYIGALEDAIVNDLLPFIEAQDGNAILFIDEVHQLTSSRSAYGMADLLKPALARGDLHCIGATTQDEFQQHIMQDSALERRFLPVTVEEPTIEDTIAIVAGLKDVYEQHHDLKIDDKAVKGAVDLANQYIIGRFHPDKDIDLIDMAAAKVAVNGGQRLQLEHVAEVVSDMTGVPAERMLMKPQEKVMQLLPFSKERIYGQDRVLKEVIDYLSPVLTGTGDPNKPAALMLLGPTGVGKTELGKIFAEYFFGEKDNLISINLSEYRERHHVDTLIGSPRGYISHDQGGVLTEAVREKPFSVVLFDEIDEAHPSFQSILLKILDEGELTDKRGRKVNFRNTIIVVTGNTKNNTSTKIGYPTKDEKKPAAADMSEVELKDKVLGRFGKVFTFDQLGPEVMGKLLDKQLALFNDRLEQNDISVSLTASLRKHIEEKGYDPKLGARALQTVFTDLVESPLSKKIAMGELQRGQQYRLGLSKGEITIKEQAQEK